MYTAVCATRNVIICGNVLRDAAGAAALRPSSLRGTYDISTLLLLMPFCPLVAATSGISPVVLLYEYRLRVLSNLRIYMYHNTPEYMIHH